MTIRLLTIGIAGLLAVITTLGGEFTAGAIYVAAAMILLNMGERA